MTEIERQLVKIAEAAFEHDCHFDRFGPSNFWMRFLVFLNDLSLYLLRRSLVGARRARCAIPALLRLHSELRIARSDILSFVRESSLELSEIPDSLPEMQWSSEVVPPHLENIPNMLEPDAMRYYVWLGRTLDPVGPVVELGSWMGGSTACLASGLRQNHRYSSYKLHVFDSFIWRNWMTQFTTHPVLSARYGDGDSFIDAFLKHCVAFRDLIEVRQCEIAPEVKNNSMVQAQWDRGPIGALVVDHSDRYDANVEAWNIFASSLVPGRTIVVFNQYGNLRAEELRRFCRDHRPELAPLHHLACSGRAFLFRGRSS